MDMWEWWMWLLAGAAWLAVSTVIIWALFHGRDPN